MDLRTGFPRNMRDLLAGYAHLARMIDKCRAVLAGTEGEYIYPCPMDERLMEFAGITSAQFTAAVKSLPSDQEVVAWFKQVAKQHDPAELEDWNQKLLQQFTRKLCEVQKIPGSRRSCKNRYHGVVGFAGLGGRKDRSTAVRPSRPI